LELAIEVGATSQIWRRCRATRGHWAGSVACAAWRRLASPPSIGYVIPYADGVRSLPATH